MSFNLSEKIDNWIEVFIKYGCIGKNDIERLNEIHQEFIKKLKEYDKNKLMGKDFILISKKDLDNLTGEKFK